MPALAAVDLAASRDALRRRQSEVLDQLLRGEVPAGFDPGTTRLTTRVLHGKRRRAAVRAHPVLADVPRLPQLFGDFAAGHVAHGCGHSDGAAFLDWAAARGALPRSVRDRWRAQQVDAGTRSVAWVRLGGRRVLVLGIGGRYAELALRPAVAGA